ncbi:MAG: SBBP repeat-containing protein, partial [Planctomycetota bacterium]
MNHIPLKAIAAVAAIVCLAAATAHAQTLEWLIQEGPDDEYLYGRGVASDGLGHVYVSGSISFSGGGDDAMLFKYDSDGDLEWSQRYDAVGRFNTLRGLAPDHLDNVYAAGSGRFGSPDDLTQNAHIVKFDESGALLWDRQLGEDNLTERFFSVAVDNAGNAYAGGRTDDQEGDALLAKYSADGQLEWTRQWGTSAREAWGGMATDASGAVFAAGYTNGSLAGENAGSQDAFVTKLDADGTLIWTRQFGTTETDRARGVAYDGSGGVFVVGQTAGLLGETSSGDTDAFVTRLDADGAVLWTRQFGSAAVDVAWGVAADEFGNVFVAGNTDGDLDGPNAGEADAFLTMFTGAGELLWTRQLGSHAFDRSQSVSTDGLGNVYAAGYTLGALTESRNPGKAD